MCVHHGTLIDKDASFTVELLRGWKKKAADDSWERIRHSDGKRHGGEFTESELSSRLRIAAAEDLEVFRRSPKWPSTAVVLTLEVPEVPGLSDPVKATALAAALTTLDDLVLVAPPGMGKTTTVFQIAEAALANGNASPIVVPLGDWSTEDSALLESVLKRPAFRGISEEGVRAVAAKPGVILLLDGWNELDAGARKRLRVQLERLQAQLPEIRVLISTREQAPDVPVEGTRINLLPLSETQQREIAKALRGEAGMRMLDQAWRTAGVRELVAIPLYLTALLALPEGAPFPTTKEEVLRRFVAVGEKDAQHREALAEVALGLHQRFLEDLAATATRAANTAISDAVARKSISETDDALAREGQITAKPEPIKVLGALVSHHHVLVRAGEPPAYSFQHQQFQEWYASHFVERLMLDGVGDGAPLDQLKREVLDQPPWEEPILFACERLSRGDSDHQKACGVAILAAFEVDPILAAEMIFRSTDAVWERVSSIIQERIRRWHTVGTVDRALRFMIGSGRPEFRDQVWPLITHANDQVHRAALRAGPRFRPSVLGRDAAKRIAALPHEVRKNVLQEIADNSGMDGLDLAAEIAKQDRDPEVKATVIDAFAFRHADRHVAEVLRSADERVFDLVASRGLVDETNDEHVAAGIEAARERQRRRGTSSYDRLRAIVHARGNQDMSGELTAIVAEMEIEAKPDAEVALLHEARNRYGRAVADGLVHRVREGRSLFYGADHLLAAAGLSLEDDALLELALSETSRRDFRAEAAASALGPRAAGRMLDSVLELRKRLRDAGGSYDRVASDRYLDLRDRVSHLPGRSLVAAVRERSTKAGNEEMAELANLISRHPNGETGRARPFDADALAAIRTLVEEWGGRLLAADDATRSQLASIAALAEHAPSVSLLPLLKRLLDAELRAYRGYREQAGAASWSPSEAANEARTLHTNDYRRAFEAIDAPQTAALMREYLHDEHFGQTAALVLAAQWTAANEPRDEQRFWGGVDFSRVEEKRVARASDPAATSPEADAIFSAIEPLIADGATTDQQKHAVVLGVVAARLLHGQRDGTLKKLISLSPRVPRVQLLLSLVLSGESVAIETVRSGIAEVFEAAKRQSWILSERHELNDWLRLLPFATPAAEAIEVVRALPADQRRIDRLEEMISAFGIAPGDDAEEVLFQLAEDEPKLFANRIWHAAAFRRDTQSAARRLVDLAARGAFGQLGAGRWHMAQQLGGLMADDPDVRTHAYDLLRTGPATPGLTLLAEAVSEHPDADGLLLLIKIEQEHKRSFTSRGTIEAVTTKHVLSETWKGAYNVVPIPAVELRRNLLALTTDGGPADIAARCLRQIDEIRDDYGTADSEPRHPDLPSGKSWPIMTPAPETSRSQ